MLRKLRLIALLAILVFVALATWLDRVDTTNWRGPLRVALYPVNADGSAAAAESLRTLDTRSFDTVERFFEREALRHGLALERPVRFVLAPPLQDRPPLLTPGARVPQVMWWSLRLRFWSWGVADPPGPTPRVRLFLLYHDPQRSPRLPHSVGLQKGLLGIAHLFASSDMMGSNQMVVAHEFLHTLGATDKYDADNQPIFPDGYAEPDREPRHPQSAGELMAGRVPLSATEAEMPESLDQVVIGPASAREIGWRP